MNPKAAGQNITYGSDQNKSRVTILQRHLLSRSVDYQKSMLPLIDLFTGVFSNSLLGLRILSLFCPGTHEIHPGLDC